MSALLPLSMVSVPCSQMQKWISCNVNTDQSIQDKVRLTHRVLQLMGENRIHLLKELLPAGSVDGALFRDPAFEYVIAPVSFLDMCGNTCWTPIDSWNHRYGRFGFGLLSFWAYVLQCSFFDAFQRIAKVLGIDLSQFGVAQGSQAKGAVFIPDSMNYAAPFTESVLEQPDGNYTFTTEHGAPSFYAHSWNCSGESVLMFSTLYGDANHCQWKYLAPPSGKIIYNLSGLKAKPCSSVYLLDALMRVDERNRAHSGEVWTWAGERSFADQIDWSFLAGRDVTYVYSPSNRESCLIGDILINRFKEWGISLKMERYHAC
nr:hypothetical protein [uncultured Pseudodesulfovibrio sp.]